MALRLARELKGPVRSDGTMISFDAPDDFTLDPLDAMAFDRLHAANDPVRELGDELLLHQRSIPIRLFRIPIYGMSSSNVMIDAQMDRCDVFIEKLNFELDMIRNEERQRQWKTDSRQKRTRKTAEKQARDDFRSRIRHFIV